LQTFQKGKIVHKMAGIFSQIISQVIAEYLEK